MKEPRVLSLLASSTETVAALGRERLLVGRSHECDFPESVRRLPSVSSPKFSIEAPSDEIDREVRRLVSEGLSVYGVDVEGLCGLKPDVIITQDHCKVCAVSVDDVERALRSLLSDTPVVVSLHPDTLSDVWRDIRRIGEAIGAAPEASELVQSLQKRLAEIEARTSGVVRRPRVAALEWIDPIMASGNWIPELVRIAGGETIFGEVGRHSPTLEWGALVEADPDVVVVLPCGFDLARTREEMALLEARPEWRSLGAVSKNEVYLLDGHQFLNRPGPRLVESAEILAEILQPSIFSGKWRGVAWERRSG